MGVLIDLHTHSSVSDGTESPAEVMVSAHAAGLDVVALTDHDSTAGWSAAADEAVRLGLAFVPGEEISCVAGRVSVHLLSYLHDPQDGALGQARARARACRAERARRMVELIGVDYALTWDDVQAQAAAGATLGRPHIADALVARGHVASRAEAFADILGAGSRYYVRYWAPDAVDAVHLVRQAGGVPVFAHPLARGRGPAVGEGLIEAMIGAGLAGLEVDHRDHTAAARRRLREIAAAHDLIVTGSSDYHGAGKPNRLGENTTAPRELERIEAQGRGRVVRP